MRFSMITALAVLASTGAVPSLVERQATTAPTVKVYNGSYLGTSNPTLGTQQFLGIPYALPPTGALRLQVPQPLNASWTEVRNATTWGNVCAGVGISSTPNVTIGQNYVLAEFGGGFTQGTAQDPRYNGSYIVQRSVELGQPIIFASINYRLNAFGFPAGADAAAAGVLNLGLRDQRQALHWVQENIFYFGGDPAKVTIWGQSAGGQSCTLQMLAYGGRDDNLFRAAHVDSGVFANNNASLATQAAGWSKFLNATGCTAGNSTLTCLRALPFATYLNASVNSAFNPAIVPDGDFLQQSVFGAISQGRFVKRPVVVGSNLDEGTSGIGAPTGVNTDADFVAAITRTWAPFSLTNATLASFSTVWPDEPSVGSPFNTGEGTAPSGFQDKRIFALWTDSVTAGTRQLAKVHAPIAPTWSYRFWQVPDNSTTDLGVYHLAEIPYYMGVLNRTARNPLGYRADTLALSKQMQTYLINFVTNADPNQGSAVNVKWPSYSTAQQALVFLRGNGTKVIDDKYRSTEVGLLIDIAAGTKK